jgi:hypothetical protein
LRVVCWPLRLCWRIIRSARTTTVTPVTLTGVVTSIQWTNPHFYFFIDVKDPNGKVANWKFEGYPPVVLNRIGWKRTETMLPGDTVRVFGVAGA